MEAKTYDSRMLRTVLDLVSSVTDELEVSHDRGGWSVSATDPSHTSMVMAELDAEPLCEGTWRVRLADLQRSLRGTEVALSADGVLSATSGNMTSRMRLLATEGSSREPALRFSATASFLAQDAVDLVKGSDPKVCQAVRVSVDGDGVSMVADDGSGYGLTLHVPPQECMELEGSGAAHLSLSLMTAFLSKVPRDAELRLELSDDYPVRMTVGGEHWSCAWVCAPMIFDE